MALLNLDIPISQAEMPKDVAAFIREAEARVGQFVWESAVQSTGFVASDFTTVYRALGAIKRHNLATGRSFCEWGSGFGVVAALAATLGFRACGIEIEQDLHDASRQLIDDFDLDVELVQGSFIPEEAQAFIERVYADISGDFVWLVTGADDAYDQLQLEPDDFDLVFAYPWPGEERLIECLFERVAAEGALLLTFNQYNSLRLWRKVR